MSLNFKRKKHWFEVLKISLNIPIIKACKLFFHSYIAYSLIVSFLEILQSLRSAFRGFKIIHTHELLKIRKLWMRKYIFNLFSIYLFPDKLGNIHTFESNYRLFWACRHKWRMGLLLGGNCFPGYSQAHVAMLIMVAEQLNNMQCHLRLQRSCMSNRDLRLQLSSNEFSSDCLNIFTILCTSCWWEFFFPGIYGWFSNGVWHKVSHLYMEWCLYFKCVKGQRKEK